MARSTGTTSGCGVESACAKSGAPNQVSTTSAPPHTSSSRSRLPKGRGRTRRTWALRPRSRQALSTRKTTVVQSNSPQSSSGTSRRSTKWVARVTPTRQACEKVAAPAERRKRRAISCWAMAAG